MPFFPREAFSASGADLSPTDLSVVIAIATDLHRRAVWHVPPDPLRLAAVEGVAVHKLPAGFDLRSGFDGLAIYYPDVGDQRDEGLWIASALAGCLLQRRGVTRTEPRVWTLAGELLAPSWLLGTAKARRVLTGHPWAPAWLVRLRLDDTLSR